MRDRLVAYHEAGHAVAAYMERVGLRLISIDPKGNAGGYIHHAPIFGSRFNPEWSDSPQVRIRGERLIRVCYGGPIAQRKFSPRSDWENDGDTDFQMAADMVLRLAAPGEHANTYLKLLDIEARQIVNMHWDLIRALAGELITRRKMKGAEAVAFIRTWETGRIEAGVSPLSISAAGVN